jgi:hypothetical protein
MNIQSFFGGSTSGRTTPVINEDDDSLGPVPPPPSHAPPEEPVMVSLLGDVSHDESSRSESYYGEESRDGESNEESGASYEEEEEVGQEVEEEGEENPDAESVEVPHGSAPRTFYGNHGGEDEDGSEEKPNRSKLYAALVAGMLLVTAIVLAVGFGTGNFSKNQGSANGAEGGIDSNATVTMSPSAGLVTSAPVAPPLAPATTSAPVTSAPIAPATTSAPVAPAATSAPVAPATTSAPVAPAATSAPVAPATTSAPVAPAAPVSSVAREEAFVTYLSTLASDPAALLDNNTAESTAIYWLAKDDPLQLDPTVLSPENQLRITQRYALSTLYFTTSGGWKDDTNWLTEDECTWFGVTCYPANSSDLGALSLQSLELEANDLTGNFPADLNLLSDMIILNMAGNAITGQIPTEIGLASNMKYLVLSGNKFTGSIPTQIGSLSDLRKYRVVVYV